MSIVAVVIFIIPQMFISIRFPEADDDDMDMGFAAGFADPFECSVGEVDDGSEFNELWPVDAGLFALGY